MDPQGFQLEKSFIFSNCCHQKIINRVFTQPAASSLSCVPQFHLTHASRGEIVMRDASPRIM